MSEEVAISVKNVSKSFRLPHEQNSGIKQVILNAFKKNKKRGYETQRVLDDISFDIKKGEFFGIVGRNGSGKSTLLKLISQIYVADRGTIQVNGTLTPFIELGVGFNPELTGRENVYMNGALLGFSNKQMDAMYDEIVQFAELERFMDQKLKNYSSGMQVRLAFSIAIRADTDILVLDEVLAVGDEAFQRKCDTFFRQIKADKSKTVVLVTHSMESVKKYCDKAVFIRDGKIVTYGDPEDVSNEYSLENIEALTRASKATEESGDKSKDEIKDFKITSTAKRILTSQDTLEFKIEFENASHQEISKIRIGLHTYDNNRSRIIVDTKAGLKLKDGKHLYGYRVPLENLNKGDYFVAASVWNVKDEMIAWVPESGRLNFCIRNKKEINQDSLLREKGEWINE